MLEETGVTLSDVVDIDSVETLSVLDVAGNYIWGEDVTFIPAHSFSPLFLQILYLRLVKNMLSIACVI